MRFISEIYCAKFFVPLLTLLVYLKSTEAESPEDTGSHDDTKNAHSRQKRFVYFNTQSPVDIGLLITLPLSFALPTFNLRQSRRFTRSIFEDGNFIGNMTSEDILPSDSFDDPAYHSELTKLTTYFTVLEIDEDICQQKVLCQIFSEPEKFKPVSDIFAKKLTVDRGPIVAKKGSRYFRYVEAMKKGATESEKSCHQFYKRCPYSAQEKLNMPALHFWSYLMDILKMEFRDE